MPAMYYDAASFHALSGHGEDWGMTPKPEATGHDHHDEMMIAIWENEGGSVRD